MNFEAWLILLWFLALVAGLLLRKAGDHSVAFGISCGCFLIMMLLALGPEPSRTLQVLDMKVRRSDSEETYRLLRIFLLMLGLACLFVGLWPARWNQEHARKAEQRAMEEMIRVMEQALSRQEKKSSELGDET